MSSRLSSDTLNKMDTILNKELGLINQSKLSSPTYFDKDNTRSLFASTDTFKHTLTHHSRRSSHGGERSPRVTFKDTPQAADYPETDMNFKMQKQLLTLQARVIELEMKLTSVNSPGLPEPKKAYTSSNRVSLANTMESSKLNSCNGSPVSRNREVELKSSLRTTANNYERTVLQSRVSPILQQDNLGISRISHQGSEARVLARSPSGISTHTLGRSTAKKSVRRDECDRDTSRVSGLTVKTNCSGTSRSGKSKKEKENISMIHQECEEEGANLHKLINRYKREYNEDKAALVKERVRGNELAEELEKLGKKMRKMEKLIGAASKSQGTYGDLMESFNKSENIRRQQRNLIENLNQEVRMLKGESEISESAEKSFKTVSTEKRNKAKRKATKAF